VVIEWDKPCTNNEEIIFYNVYVSERKQFSELDMMYQIEAQQDHSYSSYKIPDLEADCIYYVRVNAVNA